MRFTIEFCKKKCLALSQCTNALNTFVHCDNAILISFFIKTSAKDVMFSLALVCLFVCLFIC